MSGAGRRFDAIVIGAGLSGLSSALLLAEAGVRVAVMAKGGGFFHFTSGCVDLLGRDEAGSPTGNPLTAIRDLVRRQARHPYALAGEQHLIDGLSWFRQEMEAADLPFEGDLRRTMVLPTAIGSTRPTGLAPRAMAAGSLDDRTPMLIAGFQNFRDFYPPYLTANLSRLVPFPVRHVYLDLPRFHGRRHLLPTDIARMMDEPDTREEVGRLVRANLGDAGRVGFPAVLGIEAHGEAVTHLERVIGRPVFEIATLPPSVAGIRIYQALRRRAMARGVRVDVGFWLRGAVEGTRVHTIEVLSAGLPTTYQADVFILATGGIGSGGISTDAGGDLRETVFGLPVEGPEAGATWYRREFLGPEPQPITLSGIRVNERLQPVTASGQPVENIFATASNLPCWDPVREQSGEGVALATARRAAAEALAVLGTGVPTTTPATSP